MVHDAVVAAGSGRDQRFRHWLTPVYERVSEETKAAASLD
jgi:hypothetical protein